MMEIGTISGSRPEARRLVRRTAGGAFTVLELLVATAVFVLLLVLLTQVASQTLQASKVTTQQLDATQAARHVMDSLSSDLANSVNTGSAVLFQPKGDSVSLAFLTASRGPTTGGQPSRFLAVNYQLVDHQIVRSYRGVDWSATQLLQAAESAAVNGTSAVLSPAILQFAVLALLEDGTTVVRLQSGMAAPPLGSAPAWSAAAPSLFQGQAVPATWTALIPATPPATPLKPRVQALLVAIAAIDEQNLALLETAQRDIFKPPTTTDPVKEWEDALAAAPFPAPARASVRFYSKVIPLP